MYAVIKTGGKQYRVKEGDILKVEQFSAEAGSTYEFKEVLMVGEGDSLVCGSPLVKKAIVKAEVVSQGRHPKIKIIKFKRRKHYMRRMGHRQNYTQVKILEIKH